MKKSLIYATTLILLALFQQAKAQLYIAPGETIYSTSGATLYLKEALAGDATSIYGPGELSLTSSTLQLNPNSNYTNSTIIHSNLSTISTIGVTANRIFTVGSLDMQGNTTISLASNTVHELHFQPSGGYNWQGTLTITGWQGNYNGTSGTKGKVFFGTNQWGLESFFHVPMIKFYDGTYTYDAVHLTTGEIVPSVYISTSPNTILASSLCVASTFDLNFTYNSVQNFGASTTFTAQLSNEVGSFTSPTNIGTVAGNASGDQNISVTIPSSLTGGAGYRIRVISNTPSVTGSDNGTDIYIKAFTAGEIAATGETICSGVAPSQIGSTTAASGGDNSITYSWRSSADNYATAIAGATAVTYTPPSNLSTTTSYKRYAADGLCSTTATASTGTWTVTVLPVFTAGEITATGETICSGVAPSQIGSTTAASGGDNTITYSWRSSADNYATAIAGATSATYTPPSSLSATTSYRRYAKDATCNTTPTASTGTWTVTVLPVFTAGEISATGESICSGANTSEITSITAASGGDNTITYSWRSSADNYATAIVGATAATYTPPTNLTTATSYRRYATDGVCSTTPVAAVGTWTLGINISLAGTITGSSSVCSGSSTSLTLAGHSGSIQWQKSSSLNGTYTAISGATSPITSTGTLTTDTYFRTAVTNGSCTTMNSDAFLVSVTGTLAAIPSITGASTAVLGTNMTYSITPVANAVSYIWDMPAGMTVTAYPNSGSTVQVDVAGNYQTNTIKVKAVNSCFSTAWQTKTVYAPGQTGISITTTQSGAPVICGGATSVPFSATAATGATYAWTLPTGLSFAAGYDGDEQTTYVNFAVGYVGGAITCVRTTSTATNTASYSVGGVATPGSISGLAVLCDVTTTTYSIGSVPNATSYEWQLPTGMSGTSTTNSITPTWTGSVSGTVQVRATGTCGTSAWRTLSVSPVATPSGITGPTIICGAATYTITGSTMTQVSQTTLNYSVTNVAGLTYNWSVPSGMSLSSGQGTNAIVVEVDPTTFTTGQVTVTATATSTSNNTCVSSARTLTVSKAVASITGPTAICGITSATYSVPSGSGSAYTWTVPSWMTITSGSGTNSINVSIATTGTSTQPLSVDIVTSCGTVTVSRSVGCGTFTQIQQSQCGGTIANSSTTVNANWIGAGTYRFHVSGGTLGAAVIVDKTWNGFQFGDVTGALPGTYSVKVDYKPTGASNFVGYGATCSLILDSQIPTTAIATAQCGTTIASTNTTVNCTWVGPGTYRFVVSGGNLPTAVTVDKTWNGFQFGDVTGALPGSYSVAVSFKPTGYTNFGTATTCSSLTLGTSIPTTAIATTQCGTTIASTNTVVNCTWVGPGTYRFVVSGGTLSSAVTVDKTWNGFQFADVTGALPGNYSVAVSFKPTGQSQFGSATTCSSITLGTSIPTSAISSTQCGTTIASTNTTVNSTWVGPGTYRFVVSGGTLSSAVTVDKTWNGFQFADVTGALPGNYSVAVSFKPTGQAAFGAATTCNSITLGTSIPTTAIATTQCTNGVTSASTVVNCTWVGPGTYRFVVSGGTLSSAVTLDKTWNGFQFSNIPGASYGGYTVSVSFRPTGYANFGDPMTCEGLELANPGALAQQDPQLHVEQTEGIQSEEDATETTASITEITATSTWSATATSNPFATSFQIKLSGADGISAAASFTAQLTDMSGKVYSQATLNKEQLEAESFGEQLAPGMYLMTLRQGEELRVLRVIKR